MTKEYKYKFSVIIPVYNVEEYVEETIISIIEQTIGFKENIQMILINDGSPDNSEEICLKYKQKYPENIIYIKQENAGVSAARNKGLENAEGEIINFLDSDDKWSKDAFSIIYNKFKLDKTINIIACRIKHFDDKDYYHALDYKFAENRKVDLNYDYSFPQLSISSCFLREYIIKPYRFDINVSISEDFKILNTILLDEMKFEILKDVEYLYRRRKDESSAIQTSILSKDWYLKTPELVYEYLFNLSIEKYGEILPFIQYSVMYDFQWRLITLSNNVLSKKEEKKYIEKIQELYSKIEDYILVEQRNISLYNKFNYIYLKDKNYNSIKLKGKTLLYGKAPIIDIDKITYLRIDRLELHKNNICLSGQVVLPFEQENLNLFFRCNEKDYPIDLKVNKNEEVTFYDGQKINIHYTFSVKIPIKVNDKISLYLNYKNKKIRINLAFNIFSKINKKIKNHYYTKGNFLIKTSKNRILILENSNKRIFINELRINKALLKRQEFKVSFYRILAMIYRKFKKKEVFLVSDRNNVAGDNGEAFYRFLNESVNELKENKIKHYFVISKKTTDYKRLKKEFNVLDYNSIKYKLLFLVSPYLISSQADDYVLNPFENKWIYLSNFYDYKFIFLQHGIIKDDISGWLNKNNKNIKLFVVSTKPEYEEVLQKRYLYEQEDIILTGLPRYDFLLDKSKENKIKTVLLAPTWRRELAGRVNLNSKYIRDYNVNFVKSEYFKFYNSILTNKRLGKILKENNMRLRFLLHPAFESQVNDFIGSENIDIIIERNYNYELANNSLLITDFSSIFYDFGYLKKPIIYSQFDKDKFYKNHTYNKGYFSCEDDGFGEVIDDVEEIVNKIEYYVQNDFKMEKKYLSRVKNTFAYFDQNNSKRVYKEIMKLYNEEREI